MRQEIPFNGDAYTEVSTFMTGQECVNFYLRPYPEIQGGGMALIGTPGLSSYISTGFPKECRGILRTKDFLFAVIGSHFFRVDKLGNSAEIGAGTIITDSGIVGIATNGLDVTVVDGDNGYVYDLDKATLTKITDADFPGGKTIAFIAGYYFVNPPGTAQIHQSTINNGLSWPGYFDTAGQNVDDLSCLVKDHGELLAIGTHSIESWYNAGLSGFILTRRQGAELDYGSPSSHTWATVNNATYFLGQDENGSGQVFQLLGFQPTVVSTPAIEYALSKATDLTTATAFSYEQIGQSFYVLHIPNIDRTFVYDIGTQKWHERSSIITDGGGKTRNGRWRVNRHATFNNKSIAGDFENGKLYYLDEDVYSDVDQEIISTRTTAIIRKNQNSITINELQILFEPGVGLVTGQGVDPQVILDWSVDGGKTFGTEIYVPIGKIGEYANRAITPPLGQGRNWVIRIKISDPIKRAVIGAFADIEEDND